jgi:hypothetical protein
MGKSISILFQTSPYLIIRAAAQAAFTLGTLAYWAVMAGLFYLAAQVAGENAGWIVIVLVIVSAGGFFGLARLAERVVFYAIKAGHVAVITQLLTQGSLPPGVNQVIYGKEMIQKHFGTMAAFGAVDALVAATVRQVLHWLTAVANRLDFVPGLRTVWGLVRSVLSIAGNYVDEAVLSYVLIHPGENVWRMSADGVVLYAQAWKQLLGTAVVVALVIGAVWLIGFVPFFGLGLSLTPLLPADFAGMGWLVGGVAGLIGGGFVRSLFGDPVATVMMVTAYHQAIGAQVPSGEMYEQLSGASRKFRELAGRAEQPQQVPVPA